MFLVTTAASCSHEYYFIVVLKTAYQPPLLSAGASLVDSSPRTDTSSPLLPLSRCRCTPHVEIYYLQVASKNTFHLPHCANLLDGNLKLD